MVNIFTFLMMLCTLLEYRYRTSIFAALGRSMWAFTCGSWRISVAFILFSPFCSYCSLHDDVDGVRIATLLFASNILLACFLVASVSWTVHWFIHRNRFVHLLATIFFK